MTPANSLNSIAHPTCSPLAHEMKSKLGAMFVERQQQITPRSQVVQHF
jgi:hypothetical protein